MDAVGFTNVPDEYSVAVPRYKELIKIDEKYHRPGIEGSHEVRRMHKCGEYKKVPVELRLVAEELNCWKHYESAKKLRFPRQNGIYGVNPLLLEAVDAIAEIDGVHGESIEEKRNRWINDFVAVGEPIKRLDAHVAKHVPEDGRQIMASSRLVNFGAILEAVDDPEMDPNIIGDLFFGMVGAGDGQIDGYAPRDTGLFRPIAKNAAYSVSELHAGKAKVPAKKAFRDGKWVEVEKEKILPSSAAWHWQVVSSTTMQAEKVAKRAGLPIKTIGNAIKQQLHGDKNAVNDMLHTVEDDKARRALQKVVVCEVMSAEEHARSPPTLDRPMSLANYEKFALERDPRGVGATRPAVRHVIERGVKKNGDPKLRCIDNYLNNGSNGSVSVPERTDNPSFLWPAFMAILLYLAFSKRGRPVPEITHGLDDMRAAYRTVHAMFWPMVFGLIAYYSFRLAQTVVQRCPGHLFGHIAANNNFGRVPRLVCVFTIKFFVVIVWHYVDDLMRTDVASGGQSSHRALRVMMRACGYDVEDDKHEANKSVNVALGASTDLSDVASHGRAKVEPDEAKAKSLLKTLRGMKNEGKCKPAEAENIVGKTRWMTSQLRSRAGTATMQPFSERSKDAGGREWTPAMSRSLEFLEVILDDEFRPALMVEAAKVFEDDEPCLIVYTDAMYEEKPSVPGDADSPPLKICRMAINVYDQRDGKCWCAFEKMPDEYYEFFPELKQYVARGELAAAVGSLFSNPKLFAGRRVIHFVDNAPALSNMVNGYARMEDMAELVNLFHLALMALDVEWYGEWVPSKANIADIMTRPDRFHELEAGLGCVPEYFKFELPPMGASVDDLKAWIRTLKQRRADGHEAVPAPGWRARANA